MNMPSPAEQYRGFCKLAGVPSSLREITAENARLLSGYMAAPPEQQAEAREAMRRHQEFVMRCFRDAADRVIPTGNRREVSHE